MSTMTQGPDVANQRPQHFYRPHPKDGRRYCFQFVCQFTSRGGGTPSQVWPGGYPIPGLAGGGTAPDLGRGTPPRPGMGYPPGPGTGYPPWAWDGVPPPPRHGTGYPPPPPTWDIASTCYVAGGMPLAFTQEDFLVCSVLKHFAICYSMHSGLVHLELLITSDIEGFSLLWYHYKFYKKGIRIE